MQEVRIERRTDPKGELGYVCPECKEWSQVARWRETAVGCEDCGTHPALLCPACEDGIDAIFYGFEDVDGYVAKDTINLAPAELINLLKVSWRDGNGLREMFQDEWPETMHADVKRTMAEIDRWKVEGVKVDAYPEDARRCPCGESYAECRDWPGATESECPTYGI